MNNSPERTLAIQAWIQHPLPWHIEHDWTTEVHAADGYIVAKCSEAEAHKVIEWAEAQQKIIDDIWDVDWPRPDGDKGK